METLQERLTMAFNILKENGVFSIKYNTDVLTCISSFNQLQLCTNFLSAKDLRLILSVCDLFSLDVALNDCPSISGHRLSVIFEDKHG